MRFRTLGLARYGPPSPAPIHRGTQTISTAQADAQTGRAAFPAGLSLGLKLPLLITAALVAVLVTFLAAAYGLVQRTLIQAGADRAKATADQVAGFLGQSMEQRLADVRRIASDGAMRRC